MFAALAVLVATTQDSPVVPELALRRQYKKGEVTRYSSTLRIIGQLPMRMTTRIRQTVKNVYENGDADVETAVEAVEVAVEEQRARPPLPPPVVERYTPYGAKSGTNRDLGSMIFRLSSSLGPRPVSMGKAVPFEERQGERVVRGEFKLVGIEKEIARFAAGVTISSPESAIPMQLEFRSWIQIPSGKLQQAEGTLTDVPSDGTIGKVDRITFSIVRI
jgi:hypothetical protein